MNMSPEMEDFLRRLQDRMANLSMDDEIPPDAPQPPKITWDGVEDWWEKDYGVENRDIATGMIASLLKSLEGAKYMPHEEQVLLEHTVKEAKKLFKDPSTRKELVYTNGPMVRLIFRACVEMALGGIEMVYFIMLVMTVRENILKYMEAAMQDDALNDDDNWEDGYDEANQF